jgi:hypothetical protein
LFKLINLNKRGVLRSRTQLEADVHSQVANRSLNLVTRQKIGQEKQRNASDEPE